ncbi:hypothetical protein T265_10643 [Opisthorchis viverrini]|uniref:Cysteamine dioxygenase n=1 Tax=Opisthorchis viverrini TaxID=6198 RepID=A0A075A0E2_OPIVI|nr:hypothetical protein T265_10643 [Opisthorchis viverrini]KER20894.1 hypothetical protein T265_10643 [Opisthorchis viverrini]
MTSKIATVANLAVHVFQQHSIRSGLSSATQFNISSVDLPGGGPPNGRFETSQNLSTPPTSTTSSLVPDLLQRLLSSVHSLTPKDVGFDTRWISSANVYAAPVAYVHIMENEIFSMGIFILRPGSRIPLHDHPGMFGILHVIYGSLRCRSFTPLRNVKSSDSNFHKVAFSKFSDSRWQLSDIILARPYQDVVMTTESQAHLLSPIDGNFHEISAVDGPAVFLDILSPPYDHDLGTRECRFYKEVVLPSPICGTTKHHDDFPIPCAGDATVGDTGTSDSDISSGPSGQVYTNLNAQSSIIYLVETNQPKDYWCESAEYSGPSVV